MRAEGRGATLHQKVMVTWVGDIWLKAEFKFDRSEGKCLQSVVNGAALVSLAVRWNTACKACGFIPWVLSVLSPQINCARAMRVLSMRSLMEKM